MLFVDGARNHMIADIDKHAVRCGFLLHARARCTLIAL